MKEWAQIREAWEATSGELRQTTLLAPAPGIDSERIGKWNDSAYFVLFWGQFELFVGEILEARGRMPDEFEMMKRIEIFVPRRDSIYVDLDRFYGWRCGLAHGRTTATTLPSFDLHRVLARLEAIMEFLEEAEPLAWCWDPFGLDED